MAIKQSQTRRKKQASLVDYNPWLMGIYGLALRRTVAPRRRKTLPRGLQRRVVM